MTENTYEYECMRAELLGVEKPTLDEFLSKQKEREVIEEDEIDTENLKELENQKEELNNISGGLHELNNILSVTQKKLNRFKASCGSLTNLLKIKIGSVSVSSSSESIASSSSKVTDEAQNLENSGEEKVATNDENNEVDISNLRKSDLSRALDNHVDKLDSLIAKAEDCHYSMSKQNQQMKKMLH